VAAHSLARVRAGVNDTLVGAVGWLRRRALVETSWRPPSWSI